MSDPFRGLAQAYADTFEERDSRERCLHYLMPEWVSREGAERASLLIGPVGSFDPDTFSKVLSDITTAAPQTKFAFGRENSVVLYVATLYPKPVYQVIESYHPSEVDRLDDDDSIPVDRGLDKPHAHCKHEIPPVMHTEWADRHPDDPNEYLRVWWRD